MNKALLVILIIVVLMQTAAVVYAAMAQRQLLHDLRVEMTELRIQVRAEFLRIQEILDKKAIDKKAIQETRSLLEIKEQGKSDDALSSQISR